MFLAQRPHWPTDLHAIFDCDCQDQLAHALYTMPLSLAEHCLSRPQGGVVNVGMMQLIVDEDEELTVGYSGLQSWSDYC